MNETFIGLPVSREINNRIKRVIKVKSKDLPARSLTKKEWLWLAIDKQLRADEKQLGVEK